MSPPQTIGTPSCWISRFVANNARVLSLGARYPKPTKTLPWPILSILFLWLISLLDHTLPSHPAPSLLPSPLTCTLKTSCMRHPRPHASTPQGGPEATASHSPRPTSAGLYWLPTCGQRVQGYKCALDCALWTGRITGRLINQSGKLMARTCSPKRLHSWLLMLTHTIWICLPGVTPVAGSYLVVGWPPKASQSHAASSLRCLWQPALPSKYCHESA